MDQRDEASTNSLSETSEWMVYQCVHGCLHVQLGRVMLKFTREEFHRLVTLVGDAYVRLGVRDAVTRVHSSFLIENSASSSECKRTAPSNNMGLTEDDVPRLICRVPGRTAPVTRVTLDSNIHISASVFGGKPMRRLEMATEGAIRVGISDAIIAEVLRVRLTKLGWSAERVAAALETIGTMTERTAPTETLEIVKTDPDDNRGVECATAAGSEFIVSGDDLLAPGGFGGITIVTAATFRAQFDDQGR